VRAAPFDVFVGGAKVTATFPVGPVAGTAFNVTLMSYSGQLHLGLHIDPVAVAEPARLRTCLERAYADLVAGAGVDDGRTVGPPAQRRSRSASASRARATTVNGTAADGGPASAPSRRRPAKGASTAGAGAPATSRAPAAPKVSSPRRRSPSRA
jgi:hypothetical protein